MILAINWTNALVVTLIGFSLVFIVLCLLVLVLNIFGRVMTKKVRVPKRQANNEVDAPTVSEQEYDEVHMSADESAAIALALHLYFTDVHDEESHVITIKTVERRYSPWSSKIYGINNLIR